MFKESKAHFRPESKISVDSGYQGIVRLHANSSIPKKKTKKNPLTKEEKVISLTPYIVWTVFLQSLKL
jgi:hypothetical protein